MYILIDNIIGEKTIHLQYPIENLDHSKQIAIVEIFMDNITYKVDKNFSLTLVAGGKIVKKVISQGIYTKRELNSLLSANSELKPLSKTNMLANILELNFDLNELDNTNNLRNGNLSNTLLTYNISDYSDDFNHIEPRNLRYKKLKTGLFQNLILTITDQNNNLVSLPINLVLHINDS